MKNIQTMQDKIISVLGHEHPDTIFFFELCCNDDINKLDYPKFLKYVFDIIMAVNTPNLKHIYYSINHVYGDATHRVKCVEVDGTISYTSLFRMIPTGEYEYISIKGVIQ